MSKNTIALWAEPLEQGENLHLEKQLTVSKNWRITFSFEDGDAYDVNYEDYHACMKNMITKRKPRHPGGLIKRQYLEPLNMTITQLGEILNVSRKTASEIVNEQASVTPNMALRLATAFQTTPELWLNLQQKYDLWCAANESDAWKKVSPIDICLQFHALQIVQAVNCSNCNVNRIMCSSCVTH